MPSIDEAAKAYEMKLAGRFGLAVKTRRKALNLSASEVARRTAELGYPISRGAIAKIESNSRSGKVDVAELLVLSAALDVPPVLLLFLVFPTGSLIEVVPGVEALAEDAVRWVSGRIAFPRKVGSPGEGRPPNDGVKLIAAASAVEQALEERIPLVNQLEKAQGTDEVEIAKRTLQISDEKIKGMLQEVSETQRSLWSFPPPPLASEPPGPESDD
jgi:transcriptional regulator with XRE-family HTH domain